MEICISNIRILSDLPPQYFHEKKLFFILIMDLRPKDLYEKLEFDKVLTLLQAECSGELAQLYFEQLTPQSDIKSIEKMLKEAKELKLSHEKNDKFPFAAYADLAPDVKHLHIEGYVLSVESLQRINRILLIFRDIHRFFSNIRKEVYPNLYAIIRETAYDEDISRQIIRVIDEEGNIKPDASPELIRVRKAIQAKQREAEGVYRRLIQEFRQNGWLADGGETVRNGRRVLSVLVEHKRKIRGIIHDESTTGRTAFMNPTLHSKSTTIFLTSNKMKKKRFIAFCATFLIICALAHPFF
ncbi:MAG: hypothetical protein HC817_16380 [Saprospiraceae bacterium]|nr:hypothetical protein [Saprospiraceae bacterium]